MRATFFLLLSFIILGLFLWVTLSGALFFVGAIIWLAFAIITIGYSDTLTLYLLGAREVRSSDEKEFFAAASQEAYKLAVPMPRLYFYNGTLERAFVLQNRQSISLILNKTLIQKCSPAELQAITFELLLQVKKGMATKRTKVMFIMGLTSWIFHSFVALILALIPIKDIQKAADWFLNYLLHPALDVMFRLIMGEGYYKKLGQHLSEFPSEKDLLNKVGMKLRRPQDYYSIPSRKLMELKSVYKSRHFQNILALEFLPHEWDYFFTGEEMKRAE